MQQTCFDEVLMANFTEVNDTQSLDNATSGAINEILEVRCEPFDCNDNGRCVSGSCACHWGERCLPVRWVTWMERFYPSSLQKQLPGVIFKVSRSNEIESSSSRSSSSSSGSSSTPWVKQVGHSTLAHNFAKYWSIFKILSLADSAVIA